MAARNRLTCDGMRRCQRLPELTHPVDSARPTCSSSNRVPAEKPAFSRARAVKRHFARTETDLRAGRPDNLFPEGRVYLPNASIDSTGRFKERVMSSWLIATAIVGTAAIGPVMYAQSSSLLSQEFE